jgi:hypothetical protein
MSTVESDPPAAVRSTEAAVPWDAVRLRDRATGARRYLKLSSYFVDERRYAPLLLLSLPRAAATR